MQLICLIWGRLAEKSLKNLIMIMTTVPIKLIRIYEHSFRGALKGPYKDFYNGWKVVIRASLSLMIAQQLVLTFRCNRTDQGHK